MALNFHAADGIDAESERTEFITSAVLDHLDATSRDLDELSANPANIR